MPSVLSTSRRTFLGGAAATVAGATLIPAAAGFGSTIRGTVFHSRSGTGVREAGDPGIAGVLVSNGVDIAVTHADGSWELPFIPGEFIFVVKPTGWICAAPNGGSLDLSHRMSDAGVPLDFALAQASEPSPFSVLLLADTQPHDAREINYLRDTIMTEAMAQNAVFAINHGDVVFDDPDLYRRYLSLTAATGIPWHHCPGNHDMDWAAHDGDHFATWKRIFGPCHYAFQYAGVTFIMLNNVERTNSGAGHNYRGAIGERQLQFVRNLLQHVPTDQLVVLSMHIPLASFESPDEPSCTTHDRELLLEAISGHRHCLSLSGHSHTTEHHYLGLRSQGRGPQHHHHHVLTAACGSWWSGPFTPGGLPIADSRDGTPKGFHILSVDGHRYTTRFLPVGHAGHPSARLQILQTKLDGDTRESVSDSTIIRADQLGDFSLVVNVFDGGPKTAVACRWSHAPASVVSLQREARADPYIVETFARYRQDLKSWVEPAVSSHIWRAPLPRDLTIGVHRVLVSVQDEYGRHFSVDSLIEVQA